jgi:hypothetical protein
MRKQDIKIFIDGIENPSEPNQALKDAAERYEKYSERFDNKDNELVEGVFNPNNWGKRLVKEEPIQESFVERMKPLQEQWQQDMDKELSKQENDYTALLKPVGTWQETLEEAAERITTTKFSPVTNKFTKINIFIEGAKWQQERSYSEEEVVELLQKALTHKDDGEIGSLVTAQGKIRTANFFSWFNKFKNK